MSFSVPSWEGVRMLEVTVTAKVSLGYCFFLIGLPGLSLRCTADHEFRNSICNILHSIVLM